MTTETQQQQKLEELIEDMRTAMLTTLKGDQLRSRPMAKLKYEHGNVLWFFGSADSEKAHEIEADSHVNVVFSDESHNKYISISGRGSVIQDFAKAKELWTPFAKGWFEGPEDPSLRLIRVDMESAEYWDAPSSKMVYIFNLLRSAMTGKEVGMGENESVKL